MREWMQAQLAAGLPAFRGSDISGTVAVKQELVNDLIAQWLSAMSPEVNTSEPPLDVSSLRPLLKRAVIRADSGIVAVDFQISI